jgi:hypothetical protein
LAQVAVQFFARSNRHAGYMTWAWASMLDASKSKGCVSVVRLHATCMAVRPFNHRFRRGWRSACNRGAVWLLLSRASLHDACEPSPRVVGGGTLGHVSEDLVHDA